MSALDVAEICDRLNQRAPSLAPQLLPNGHRSGNHWVFSGIDDTGKGTSAWLYLAGPKIGHWQDAGNARAGEERGDMLDLVQLTQCGGDKRRALEWAKAELGIEDDFKPGERPQMSAQERAARAAAARARAEEQERRVELERERKAKNARRLFLNGEPLAGSPAESYLRGRGIAPPALPADAYLSADLRGEVKQWPGSLRYHPRAYCGPLGGERPAMLAGIFTAQGVQIGTHRTFLGLEPRPSGGAAAAGYLRDGAWGKLKHPDLADPKMVLGNQWGGFVPINQGSSGKSMREMPDGEPVYVTEGIEDALCVRMLKPAARIVCALNLGNIGAIVLPQRVRELVIVADRDDNSKAQDTLERAIARQQARGMTVCLVLPPPGIKDINDWVRAGAPEQRRRA